MDLLRLISAVIICLFFRNVFSYDSDLTIKKNWDRCKDFSVEPNFDADIVVGLPWRIVYTWNMRIDGTCLYMTFQNATPMVVHRFWSDMNEYLENQPYWDAATLLMKVGNMSREVLLLATQGAAGSFTGVPDVMRYGNITPLKKSVQMLTFQMKLIEGDKFLVVVDCESGVSSMFAREHHALKKTEIDTVANSLHLGEGFPACIWYTPK